jgi:hypothetical protein
MKVTDFMGVDGEAEIELSNGHQVVVLSGINGAGKTSFRLAIESLFNSKSDKLLPKPIREGKSESRAEFIDTEADVKLSCVWRLQSDGSITATFSAVALDNSKYPSPRAFAAALLGGTIVDGSEFVALDAPKQREVLLNKVDLPFDLPEITAKRKALFDGRTDVSREVRRLTAQLEGMPPEDPSVPAAEVEPAALVAELDAIRAHNVTVDGLAGNAIAAAVAREELEARGAALKAQLDEVREQFKLAREVEAKAVADAAAAERKSEDAVAEKLATIGETNAKVRDQAARAKVAAEHAAQLAAEAKLNADLDKIDQQKADGLAAATFPVPGLSIDDDGVTYNGLPFKSLNEGEQQFVAFCVAIAGERKIKLGFLANGDALDNDTLARIIEKADAEEFTLVVDRGRDNSPEFGFHFNKGTLEVTA